MSASDLSGVGGTGSSGIQSGVGGGGATLGDVANAFRVEFITLSLTDILNQYANITDPPESAVKTKIEIIEGLPADYGIDYTVDTVLQRLNWAGLGLDGILTAGDKIRITYFSI
jgi:hypothetical protein